MKMIHKMHLNQIPFRQIVSGAKKIELRLYDEKRSKILVGDYIEFCLKESNQKIMSMVVSIDVFPTFKELYEYFSIADIGYDEKELSIASYKDMEEYYSIELQKKYSVVGITFKLV